MGRTRCAALGFILLLGLGLSSGQPPAPNTTIALTGATIRTQTDAGDFVGTVVIRDGKIAELGPNVKPPVGATVIDVAGCSITPGLIDAHGMLGLQAAAASESGREASLDILDAVDPFNDDWRDAARQGVTAVYVQPAAGGNLGGSGAVLRVCGGDCADKLSLRSPAGIQVALGIAPASPAAQNDQLAQFLRQRGIQAPAQPQAPTAPPPSTTLTRFSQYEQVRGQFNAAKQYGADKPTRRDAAKELLLRATKGEVPVRIEIHTEDDVRNALKLAADFGLKTTFERIERVRPVPEELRASQAALILGARPSGDVRKLALDGRKFAIGTFGESRDTAGLRLQAATAVAAGFPRDRVLRALTADAADVLGVGDKLGRLAVGRPADLAVFAGDPLDASASVRMTVSQGVVTYDATTQRLEGLDQEQVQKIMDEIQGRRSRVAAKPSPDGRITIERGAENVAGAELARLPDKLPPTYAIKTTRLLQANGEFAPGELRVANGLIAGRDPEPSAVYDLGDAPITPGLVAAHVSVGGELNADADAAQLRALDGLTADDGRLRACRDAGFLTTVAAPGSSNVIGGTTEVPGVGDVGVKFVLTAAARNNERFPISLAGQVEMIDARLRGEPSETNLYLPPALQKGLFAERDRVMEAVRTRRVTACFEVQARAEIQAALRLIAEHKLRGVLLLPRDTHELKDEVIAGGVGVAVVVAPLKPRDAERNVRGLVEFAKLGGPLALGGDPAEMRTSAALLANAGLSRSLARRALAGQPVEPFGLPAGTGRLAIGAAADFVVWTNDPLDPTSRPAAVVTKGERKTIATSDDAPSADPRRPAAGAPARTGRRGR